MEEPNPLKREWMPLDVKRELPTFLKVLVFLCFSSLLMPLVMQYFVSATLLIWFIVNRLVLRRKHTNLFLYEADQSSLMGLTKGLLVLFVLGMIFTVVGSTLSPYFGGIRQVFVDAWYLNGMQALLPLSLVFSLRQIRGQYDVTVDLARPVAIYILLYASYCFIQRYSGVNLLQGLEGTLPSHRSVYGIYRISGFMEHPLDLAWNLILTIFLFLHLAYEDYSEGFKSSVFWWCLSSVLCAVMLVLCGSVWPILVLCCAAGMWFSKFVYKKWYMFLLAALAIGGAFLLEGKALSVFSSEVIKEEAEERLVFWKIHKEMFLDNPIWGVGYSSRKVAAVDYYHKHGYNEEERKYSAHNQFLQTLADSGVLGFGLLFGFWFWALIQFKLITDASVRKLVMMSVLVTLLGCAVSNVLRDSEFVFALWFCIAYGYFSLPAKGIGHGRQSITKIKGY